MSEPFQSSTDQPNNSNTNASTSATLIQSTQTTHSPVIASSSRNPQKQTIEKPSTVKGRKSNSQQLESKSQSSSRPSTPNLQGFQPSEKSVCSTSNLKRKTAIGELGDALEMMTDKGEKRRRLRDEDIEVTKRELDTGITQRLRHQLCFDLRIAELAGEEAARVSAEKKAKREYQLEMRRLDLLEKGITLPSSHNHLGQDNHPAQAVTTSPQAKKSNVQAANIINTTERETNTAVVASSQYNLDWWSEDEDLEHVADHSKDKDFIQSSLNKNVEDEVTDNLYEISSPTA